MHNAEQYLLYLRKSRKDLQLEELGIDVLERHENTLLDLAKKMNISIGGIFREVVSGDSISARPEMQKLLHEVESGKWRGVLVMEVERLARGDTIDQGIVARAFQYSDTMIVTPAKIYDPSDEFDQEYFEFGLFMSRREYKTIKRRLQTGRLRSVQDGFYVGNIPPYGYDRIKAPDGKHYTLQPNSEAPAVELIFDLYANKLYGYDRICTELNRLNIMPRKSDRFSPATVKDIIANPVYIGFLRWNWRKQERSFLNGSVTVSRPKHETYDIYKGIHTPIIDEELFKRANSRRGNWNAPAKKGTALQNPLAGLIFCSECGRNMIRKSKTCNQPYDTMQCPTTGCKTVSCRFDIVEKALLEELRKLVTGYSGENIAENSIPVSPLSTMLEEKKKELESLEEQRLKIYDLLERGIYTEDVFLSRQKMNADRKAELVEEVASITEEMQLQELQSHQIHTFIPRCEDLLGKYNKLNTEQKNKALKLLIKKVVYKKTERNKKGDGMSTTFSLEVTPFVPIYKWK